MSDNVPKMFNSDYPLNKSKVIEQGKKLEKLNTATPQEVTKDENFLKRMYGYDSSVVAHLVHDAKAIFGSMVRALNVVSGNLVTNSADQDAWLTGFRSMANAYFKGDEKTLLNFIKDAEQVCLN